MSEQLTPLVLSPGALSTSQIPQGLFALKVSNTSPYDLSFSGFGVSGDDVQPAGIEYMLYADVYSSPTYKATLVNNRNIVPASPGVILLVAYYTDNETPKGHWPATIPTSLVNANTNVTTSQYLTDTADPPGTTVIKIQPTDVAGTNPTVSIDNSGNVVISTDNAGVLTQILQIFAGASPGITFFKPPNVSVSSVSVNGTAGTATLWETEIGNFKRVIIFINNYQNGNATEQVLNLPTPFTRGAIIRTGNIGSSAANAGVNLFASGTALTLNVMNGIVDTGSPINAQSHVYDFCFGEATVGFDAVHFQASGTAGHTGFIFIEGQ